jgi:DNA-binding transcriptional MerR regulator
MQAMKLKSTQVAHKKGQHRMMKIGEVSKRSNIGIETLRFYERSGLLDKPARTDSGYRMYDPKVLERLTFIKRAQFLGFSLEEIKQIIDEKRAGYSPCTEVRNLVRLRLHELDEHIQEMQRYYQELVAKLAEWDEIGEVQGHVCGLIESSNFADNITQVTLPRKNR